MSTSMPQSAVQTQMDSLFLRLFNHITQVPVTLAGTHTVTVFSPSGTELVATTSTGITVDGNVAEYRRLWDSATFPLSYQPPTSAQEPSRQYYRIRWVLNDGDFIQDSYFELIRRRFLPTLMDVDFTERHSYLVLPSGQSDFSSFRKRAWERITSRIEGRISRNAGDVYLPETFASCHEYWSLSDFFLSNMIDATVGGEDRYKAERYEELGNSAFEAAISQIIIDTDVDGIVTPDTETFNYNGIRVVR